MNTSLALIAAKALPALSGSSLTYNAEKNVYLTLGYTSAAGNTYYRAIRLSDRLAVYYHIGQGYAHTFLNGITLFAWNGQKANIIAQKFWGGCNWRCFNERSAKEESILMLKDFLKGQAKAMGSMVAESQLLDFSRSMIEATHQKRMRKASSMDATRVSSTATTTHVSPKSSHKSNRSRTCRTHR